MDCVGRHSCDVYLLVPLDLVCPSVNRCNFLVFSFYHINCLCMFSGCLFSLIRAICIVSFTTSALKVVPLSVRMMFRTYAFFVNMDISRIKRVANRYIEKTLNVVMMCVKLLDGGSGRTKSISNRSSGPLLVSYISLNCGRKCCLAIGFNFIQIWQLFINSWTFSATLGQFYCCLILYSIYCTPDLPAYCLHAVSGLSASYTLLILALVDKWLQPCCLSHFGKVLTWWFLDVVFYCAAFEKTEFWNSHVLAMLVGLRVWNSFFRKSWLRLALLVIWPSLMD